MISKRNDTALIFFSRSAAEEASKKVIVKGSKHQNVVALKSLIDRTGSVAKQSGFPLIDFTGAPQNGKNFGERLANALQQVFDTGYQKIIVIGNDCLNLSVDHIQNAALKLNEYDQVLAPTTNGGVYLIGLNKSTFQKNKLANLEWQTENVFNELRFLARSTNHSVYSLVCLQDVNNYHQLVPAINFLPALDKFKKVILSILSSNSIFVIIQTKITPYFIIASKNLRGPPLSI